MAHTEPLGSRLLLAVVVCVLPLILLWQSHRARPAPPVPVQPANVPAATTVPVPTSTSESSGAPIEREAPVVIDPGHGGADEGVVGYTAGGTRVAEKTVALEIARRTADLLRAAGIPVVLTRSDDSLVGAVANDSRSGQQSLTPEQVLDDLQRRIDLANAAGARLVVSIHLNSYTSPAVGGSETIYCDDRPFSAQSQQLARLVQERVIDSLRSLGYAAPDRGVTDDEHLGIEGMGTLPADYRHLVLLGPAVSGRTTATQAPGVLSEPLFLSNPDEAALAIDPSVQDRIAAAYADAIEQFLSTQP